MKRLFTFAFFLIVSVTVQAQTFIDLNFSGSVPPTGWTIDAHSTNWKSSATNNAQGTSPECMFDWSPQFTGVSRLISPVINLTGVTTLKLMFNHMIDHYGGAYIVGVATRSGGGAWNDVWTKVNPSGNVTEAISIDINNANVGASDFQICWYFSGNTNNIDYWYLDDILLYSPLAHDATVQSILTFPEYQPNVPFTPQAIIKNMGLNGETFTATCSMKVNGSTVYTQNCPAVTLAAGESQNVSFPQMSPAVANDIYEVTVTTNLAGDLNTANDSKIKYFDTYTTERNMVILEIGTGTWCQYCPGASMGAHDLLINGKSVGVVKYHNGDTFTNTYSNARNTYYGISGFPTAVFDGTDYFVGGSNTQSMYQYYLPMYEARKVKNCAYTVEIFGTHSGLNYTVQLRVRKLANITATPVVHLALTESNIPFSWQGQTEVNNAERLMSPDQNGTVLDFSSGNEVVIERTFTLTSSWVVDNLELVSFVQNTNNKEILQGTKVALNALEQLPVELTSFTAAATKDGIVLHWGTATEINNNGFEIEKSIDGKNFHTIGFVKGNGTTTETKEYTYTDKSEFSDANIIYYRLKQVDFNGNFEYSDVIQAAFDIPNNFTLGQNYPNPFNPTTKIVYAVPEAAHVNITLYDITGQEAAVIVNEQKDPGVYEINFSAAGLSSGIYFYRMNAGDFTAVKKLSILK